MKIKGLRWWVVGLIALATVINYIDRQSLGVLWPEIAKDLYPDSTDDERKEIYALISTIFIFSYAFGQAIFGKVFDWVGTRMGFVLSIGVWSIATAFHAIAQGILSFSIFRAILGVAEAGNWPGAAKGNAEWFPSNERAFAQGLFNSGAAIGGIISIPLIAYLTVHFSWKSIFILVGKVCTFPIAVWKPKRITAIINTAVTGSPGSAINKRDGSIIKQPMVITNFLVLFTLQPTFILF